MHVHGKARRFLLKTFRSAIRRERKAARLAFFAAACLAAALLSTCQGQIDPGIFESGPTTTPATTAATSVPLTPTPQPSSTPTPFLANQPTGPVTVQISATRLFNAPGSPPRLEFQLQLSRGFSRFSAADIALIYPSDRVTLVEVLPGALLGRNGTVTPEALTGRGNFRFIARPASPGDILLNETTLAHVMIELSDNRPYNFNFGVEYAEITDGEGALLPVELGPHVGLDVRLIATPTPTPRSTATPDPDSPQGSFTPGPPRPPTPTPTRTPTPTPTPVIRLTAGEPVTLLVGQPVVFNGARVTTVPRALVRSVVIDWGDGTPVESGNVVQATGQILGNHSYSRAGSFVVTITALVGDRMESATVVILVLEPTPVPTT